MPGTAHLARLPMPRQAKTENERMVSSDHCLSAIHGPRWRTGGLTRGGRAVRHETVADRQAVRHLVSVYFLAI